MEASRKGILKPRKKSTSLPISSEIPGANEAKKQDIALNTDDNGHIIVSPNPDVILACRAKDDSEQFYFKANSTCLKGSSRYFDHLLGDVRFAEGFEHSKRFAKDTGSSSRQTGEQAKPDLPVFEIVDVGRTSPVKSIKPLVTDLLLILHGHRLDGPKIPLVNLANLAVAADRFDVTPVLATYVRSTNAILRPKALKTLLTEEAIRQRLLLGLLLEDGELVRSHSKDLILRGSKIWTNEELNVSEALWWDLPRHLEG